MTKRTKSVFISAGDCSGDSHAAKLMQEMLSHDNDIEFKGFGLAKMHAAGLSDLDFQSEQTSDMWLHNLLNLAVFRKRLELARELFQTDPPELAILVDYGGFNLFLAKAAHQAGIPVLYYILPQAWAHGRYRLKKVRKWVDRAAVIYPFEPPVCLRYGVDAQYVGHPLFDELQQNPPHKSAMQEPLEGRNEDLIAVFPGSRRQEIRANLPVILNACYMLRERYKNLNFVSSCPPGPIREEAAAIINTHKVDMSLSDSRPIELARTARLCITKSGTVTLEIATQHTPMVILYRINAFLYFLISGMTHTPYAGIINSLAGEMVCPEKVMWRSDPRWICNRARRFLEDEQYYEANKAAIASLIGTLDYPGASRRTAEIAFDMM